MADAFALTYAGIPFRLPPPGLAERVERLMPLSDLRDVQPRPPWWPAKNLQGASFPDPPADPAPRLFEYFYPTGAARWSVFRGLATWADAQSMIAAAFPSSGTQAVANTFTIQALSTDTTGTDGTTAGVSTKLYLLSVRPLTPTVYNSTDGTRKDLALCLVTLVDERYYWQGVGAGKIHCDAGSGSDTWANLLQTLATALGAGTLSLPTISSSYGSPEPDSILYSGYEPAAALLDIAAANVGSVVVRNLDGTYAVRPYYLANSDAQTSRAYPAQGSALLGGEVINASTQGADARGRALYPSSVVVTFPKWVTAAPAGYYEPTSYRQFAKASYGDVYAVTVTPADLGSPYTTLGTFPFARTFHTTAKATFAASGDASPTNATNCTNLAKAIAQDFYDSQRACYDVVLPGIRVWSPEGSDDLLWCYRDDAGGAWTRVSRKPFNQGWLEYQHSFGALAPAGGGGTFTLEDDTGAQAVSGVVVEQLGPAAAVTITSPSAGIGRAVYSYADATHPGLVSLSAQTVGDGAKTFRQAVTVNSSRQSHGLGADLLSLCGGLGQERADSYVQDFSGSIQYVETFYDQSGTSAGSWSFAGTGAAWLWQVPGSTGTYTFQSSFVALGFGVASPGYFFGGKLRLQLNGVTNPGDVGLDLTDDTGALTRVFTSRVVSADDATHSVSALYKCRSLSGASGTDALGNVFTGGICTTVGAGGAGSGTVTSVGLSLPASVFTVTGSPVTTSGTLTGAFVNQSANTVFAGPTAGGTGTPAFRALVQSDIPVFVGDSGSGGQQGGVPAPAAGDAAALKFLRADATWAVPTFQPTTSSMPLGRLTLVSGTPVPTSDQSGITTLRYTPYLGDRIRLYDGVSKWSEYAFAELSLQPGSRSAATVYDVFVYLLTGAPALDLGPAWSSTTARAFAGAIGRQNGLWVNSASMTMASGNVVAAGKALYVGTVYTVVSGNFQDSADQRYVWNCYNRVRRWMSCPTEATASWTYTTATYRQANANANNRLQYVVGQAEDGIDATVYGLFANSTQNVAVSVGVGVDSTTTNSAQLHGGSSPNVNGLDNTTAHYRGYPGIGFHQLNWLEYSTATGLTTWFGQSGSVWQAGIVGSVMG